MNFNQLKGIICFLKKKYNLYFREKKKTLMKQVRKHNKFLTHCTIFINHIFLKSPVAKSEKNKKRKKKKVNQLKLASVCVHPKSLLQFAGHPKSRAAHTHTLSLAAAAAAAKAKAKDNSIRRRGSPTPTRLVHKYISFFTHVVYFFLYFFLTKSIFTPFSLRNSRTLLDPIVVGFLFFLI